MISIVTVCFNEDKRIEETLRSVENQTYDDYEHIVIDGNSTDGTIAVLEKWKTNHPAFRYVTGRDSGLYDAMNKGVIESKGDFIYFLNAGDTFYSKDVLKNVSFF